MGIFSDVHQIAMTLASIDKRLEERNVIDAEIAVNLKKLTDAGLGQPVGIAIEPGVPTTR